MENTFRYRIMLLGFIVKCKQSIFYSMGICMKFSNVIFNVYENVYVC
jgi:hypothetical protein